MKSSKLILAVMVTTNRNTKENKKIQHGMRHKRRGKNIFVILKSEIIYKHKWY